MNLLETFIEIISLWRPTFTKKQSFVRAAQHCLAALCLCGRKTITQLISVLGQDQQDWSAHYKLYSKRNWEEKKLFQPIIENALPLATGNFIHIAVDDTKIRKTGRKIPSTSWQRDPLGPPFQVNLIWAQRFLHFSMLLPLYNDSKKDVAPRSIPIRFTDAPSVKKPGKKATKEQIDDWKKERKERNLSTLFLEEMKGVRTSLDQAGAKDKVALIVADGSFCNRICMNMDIDRVEMVARCKKNAKLCFPASDDSRRFYDEHKFTPEQIRQDANISWKKEKIFHGGRWRNVEYKEMKNVLWQGGTKRRPLRLIVLRPVRYRVTKKGRAYYRQPAYLLCTEVTSEVKEIIQAYFDRWQIEVNHREQKSIIGVGEAQVRSKRSVDRQPALLVAAYSALLLSSVLLYGDKMNAEMKSSIPKWYKTSKRPSCRQLVAQLRKELLTLPEKEANWAKILSTERFVEKIAA